jgi:hypothetical protein
VFVERVVMFYRVKVRPRGSVDLTVNRLAGHDQTPKQPEHAMVEVGVSTDAVPRDRRRRENSKWFQPGHSRGPTKVGIAVMQYQESEGGGSALVFRSSHFVPCVRGGSTWKSAQVTPRPARDDEQARVLSLLPEQGN